MDLLSGVAAPAHASLGLLQNPPRSAPSPECKGLSFALEIEGNPLGSELVVCRTTAQQRQLPVARIQRPPPVSYTDDEPKCL